jgi:hypothetical protein
MFRLSWLAQLNSSDILKLRELISQEVTAMPSLQESQKGKTKGPLIKLKNSEI